MLELAEEIAALRRELQQLRNQIGGGSRGGRDDADFPPDERPPHY
jgi:hypothetical protein